MRTIIFAGHLSRFGGAFLTEILRQRFFIVQKIVIAKPITWVRFYRRLQRVKYLENEKRLLKRYKKQTDELVKKIIKDYPAIEVMQVEDVNAPSFYNAIGISEIALTAAYPQIFSDELTNQFFKGMVNYHPSYLPAYRGAHPVYWTIANGEDHGGISCHFVTPQIDRGDLLARIKIPINREQTTYKELYDKILDAWPSIIEETIMFIKHSRKPIIQEEHKASYFTEDLAIHHKIYFMSESGISIKAKILAGQAFAYSMTGHVVQFFPPATFAKKTKVVTNNFDDRILSGTLVFINRDTLIFRVLDGYIKTSFKIKPKLQWRRFLQRYNVFRQLSMPTCKLLIGQVLK